MDKDNLVLGEYREISELSDYLLLDSRRYDSGFGGEQ